VRLELELPPEEYERLADEARARGPTVEQWVGRLLARTARELAREAGRKLWRRTGEMDNRDVP
jgi:hypothetical protein